MPLGGRMASKRSIVWRGRQLRAKCKTLVDFSAKRSDPHTDDQMNERQHVAIRPCPGIHMPTALHPPESKPSPVPRALKRESAFELEQPEIRDVAVEAMRKAA